MQPMESNQKTRSILISILILVLPAVLAYSYIWLNKPNSFGNRTGQIAGLLAALLTIGYTLDGTAARAWIDESINTSVWKPAIHWGWFAVLAILLFHSLLVQYLLPGSQTLFEELQTGGNGYEILKTAALDIEFRYTNVIAALGFANGSFSLGAMRMPFRLLSLCSLVLAALTLRKWGIQWPALLLTLLVLATTRMLVLGASIADELFAGSFLLIALIYCLVSFERSSTQRPLWSALAGCVAGMLLYEYSSYRAIVLLGIAWLILRTFRPGRTLVKANELLILPIFLITMFAMAAPTLSQTIAEPGNSIFLEGFRRHAGERPPMDIYIGQVLNALRQYVASLLGMISNANGGFYVLNQEPLIPTPLGFLLALSLLGSLLFPLTGLARGMGLTIILMIGVVSLSANNLNIGRLVPAFIMLVMLAGLFVQRISNLLETWQSQTSKQEPIRKLPSYVFQLAIWVGFCYVCVAHIGSVLRFAQSEHAKYEFTNNEYAVCQNIGYLAHANQLVIAYTVNRIAMCNSPDDVWLYRPGVRIVSVDHFPEPADMQPGALIVIGKTHGLSGEESDMFLRLAQTMNELDSIRSSEDISGSKTTLSFCFLCIDNDPPKD